MKLEDGQGVKNVTIDRIRINDFFFAEDSAKVGRGWWKPMSNAIIDWPFFVVLGDSGYVGKIWIFFPRFWTISRDTSIYIRLNPFWLPSWADLDFVQVGAPIPGNDDCRTDHWMEECCFCKPNGVRSTQLAVWVPDSRGAQGRWSGTSKLQWSSHHLLCRGSNCAVW